MVVECSRVLEECSTSVFRVTVGFRWMLKWLGGRECVTSRVGGILIRAIERRGKDRAFTVHSRRWEVQGMAF